MGTTGMLDKVDAPDLIGPVLTKLTVNDKGTEKALVLDLFS